MPIYPQSDVPPSVMDNAIQAPTGFDVSLPEGTNPEPQQPQPSVWGAAFRQNNSLVGMVRLPKQFEPADGYNPYADKNEIRGYEQWGSAFADSQSPEQTAWIKNQIDEENEDRRVTAEAGWRGTLANIASGMLDPVTLASMFIPGAQGSLAVRIGSQIAIGTAGTALSEVALNNQQYTRTARESAAHIAAGALLSGVFATAGAMITPSVRNAATREVAEALDNMNAAPTINNAADALADTLPNGGSVGAMRIREATLEDLTPVSGGPLGKLAKKAGSYLTPITRLMESPSKEARRTALELAENNFTLEGNLRGIETPVAAETRVRGWRREEAAVVTANKQAYTQYKAEGGELGYTAFREQVGEALRNGDVHVNAKVQEAAQAMRTVINRVKTAQQELGLLPPDAELKAMGQTSYFPRVYKVGKIVSERDKFRNMLVDWWSRGEKTMSREDAEIAADTTINRIVGAKIPQEFASVFMVKAPGSTKSRTLSVPDRLMKDYLESDANYVLQRHIREASAEIELTRTFGNKSLDSQLAAIQDEYDALMRLRPAEQEKLAKAREADLRDILALRDRLVGTYGMPDDASAFSLIFTDARGHLYWHVCQGLTGELAEFDDNDKITGGQVMQIKELVLKYQIPLVCVEVNGPGSFAGKLLIQALKGTGCGVREEFSVTNKQKRILDAFEAPLSSRFLWAHTDVLDGPMYDQMRDFNPALTNQPDDFIDSGSGAISSTPVRIGKLVGIPTAQAREHWQPNDGDHMVAVDY